MSIQIRPKVAIFDQTSHPVSILAPADAELIVTPGEVIASTSDLMLGHGTYSQAENGEETTAVNSKMVASLAGRVVHVNKLVYVVPPLTRYFGKVGDVIVGRITEVTQKRWRVDTNSRQSSGLPLTNVVLPGGELRRKSEEDERAMRQYLREGDLIVAEIRDVHTDGALILHMRSQKYGKLGQGCLIKVPASLVRRQKMHIHPLPCGITLILGTNGLVWVGATRSAELGFLPDMEPVTPLERENIIRIRNCVLLLSNREMSLFITSVLAAYEASLKHHLKNLLEPETQNELIQVVLATLAAEDF